VESIPLRNCFLSVSFLVTTIPDRNRHRRFTATELRIIGVTSFQGTFEYNRPAVVSPVAILNNGNGKALSPKLDTLQSGDDPYKVKILASLEKNRWNKTLTAKDLNISRATLWRKMKAYSLHNN